MVSIKNIAVKCGVSIATVSKALNDHKDVSESTKQLVRETAKEMGYLPNANARALKTNRTYNLGVIFVEKAQSGLTHNYFASVLNGFKNQVESRGYDITFINREFGSDNMSYYEHCKYRNVDGVLIACVDFYNDSAADMFDSDIPVIAIDYAVNQKLSVISDNSSGMKSLIEYCYRNGHTKIAYVFGDTSDVTSARINSYVSTLKSLGIPLREDYLEQSKYRDPKLTEEMFEKLVQLSDPPTCILLPDDFAAIGAMNAADRLGLKIPDDISIVGYDGIILTKVLSPQLTTWEQDTERLGMEAAKQLIRLINKEITQDEPPIIIEGKLIEGQSVKRLTD